jgi:hypothetical protein
VRNIFYLLLILVSPFVNAQTKASDFFRFYKGGDKYLKPVKYVLFDSTASNAVKQKVKGNL